MKGLILKSLVTLCMVLFVIGCAAAPQFQPTPFTPQTLEADRYTAKVDVMMIVFSV